MKKTHSILSSILALLLIATICPAQTGVWQELKPQNSPPPRDTYGMAEIGEGKAIIFGGGAVEPSILDDTWIYDYNENNWTQVNCDVHPSKRFDFCMARITRNKVLFYGGVGDQPIYSDTWLFDLETMKWTELKPAKNPGPRRAFCMAQLMENKVVLFGGDSGYRCNDTWIYDITENNWTRVPLFIPDPMPPKCEHGMMAQIDTGKVLFFGGWNAIKALDETWLFDYSTMKWEKITPKDKPIPVSASSVANINKNQVVLWGGEPNPNDSIARTDTVWIFNLQKSNWFKIETSIILKARFYHSMVKLENDKILLFAGSSLGGHLFNDSWLFTLQPNGVTENLTKNTQSSFLIQNNKAHIPTKFAGLSNWKLYDIYGKVVLESSQAGAWEQENSYIDFDASGLANGVYFLVVQGGKKTEVIRLIVAR